MNQAGTAAKRSSSRTGVIVAAVLVLAGLIALAVWRFRAIPVEVADVVTGLALDTVYAVGTVEPRERATIRARVGGVFSNVEARRGDAVHGGAMIARIDAPTLVSDVDRGRFELDAASSRSERGSAVAALSARIDATEALQELAESELGRARQLDARGLGSTATVEAAAAEVERLDHEIDALRAERSDTRVQLASEVDRQQTAVDAAQVRLSEGQVQSPIDGTVLERLAEPGEVVQQNQALFRVGNLDTLHIEAEVDEADIARIDVGTRASVRLAAFDEVFDAVVTAVAPDADRTRETYTIELAIHEPGAPEDERSGEGSGDGSGAASRQGATEAVARLRSGMTAEVNVIIGRVEDATLVPAGAIDEGSVWVVADGRAERREVQVGICDLERCQVVSGLSVGEQVVATGLDRVRAGARVRARSAQ